MPSYERSIGQAEQSSQDTEGLRHWVPEEMQVSQELYTHRRAQGLLKRPVLRCGWSKASTRNRGGG